MAGLLCSWSLAGARVFGWLFFPIVSCLFISPSISSGSFQTRSVFACFSSISFGGISPPVVYAWGCFSGWWLSGLKCHFTSYVGAFLWVTLIDFSFSHSPLFSSKIYVLFRQYMIPFSFSPLLCHREDETPTCEKDMDQLNDQDRIPIEGLLYHIAIISWSDLDHLVLFFCSWATILSSLGLLQSTCLICAGNTSFVHISQRLHCMSIYYF